MQYTFDIGNPILAPLMSMNNGKHTFDVGLFVWDAADRNTAGNGSLMRISPVVVYVTNETQIRNAAISDSLITHAGPRCLIACSSFMTKLSD